MHQLFIIFNLHGKLSMTPQTTQALISKTFLYTSILRYIGNLVSKSSACDKQEQKRHVSAKGHNIPVFSEGYVIKLAGMN